MSSNPYINFSLFFTIQQQDKFSKYCHEVVDGSLISNLFKPAWRRLSKQVPVYVAPNVLNLAALVCLLQAFYLCLMYMDELPRTVSVVSMLLLLSYHTLDSVSGFHARAIGNDSPLGELFQYSCSNIGVVFTAAIMCYVMGIRSLPTLWFAVQIAQLICLREHVRAFKRGYVQISVLGGEAEVIWGLVLVVVLRVVFGLEPFNQVLG